MAGNAPVNLDAVNALIRASATVPVNLLASKEFILADVTALSAISEEATESSCTLSIPVFPLILVGINYSLICY